MAVSLERPSLGVLSRTLMSGFAPITEMTGGLLWATTAPYPVRPMWSEFRTLVTLTLRATRGRSH